MKRTLILILLICFCLTTEGAYAASANSYKRTQESGNLRGKAESYSSDKETLLQAVNRNIENEDYTEAMLQLNKLLISNPTEPRVYTLSSNLLRKTYQFNDAEKMARKAIQLDYKNSEAYLALGYVFLEKAKTAINAGQSALQQSEYLTNSFDHLFMASQYDQSSPYPHIALAEAYVFNKQPQKAKDEILKAQELAFDMPMAYYRLGQYYYQQGNYNKAGKYVEKAIKQGLTWCYKTHFLAGMIAEQDGKVMDAQKYYLQALKIKPDMAEAQKRLDDLIKTSYKKRRADENAPVDLFEDVSEDLNALLSAEYQLMLDNYTQARDIYVNLLEKNPGNANAASGIAELYFAKWKDGFPASDKFTNDAIFVIRTKPSSKNVISFLKFEMISSQKMPEDIRQKLINLSISESAEFYDLLNEVRAEFLLGNYEECHNKLYKLMKMNLSNYEKFKILKYLCYDRNYYEALILIQDLKKTYYHNEEIEPVEARIRTKIQIADDNLNKALALWKDKKYTEAINIYKSLMNSFAVYKPAYLHYALAMDSMGKYDEAYEKYNVYYKLYKLYPDKNPEISESELRGLIKESYRKQKEQIKQKS
ncbi:MAG: tetratricopeptide repeat protein [Candidatus Gastranaerophilales bacterium]|nr:tetratricopeptide repeat protein [Candidatus Gastranaerophilales bacterium]